MNIINGKELQICASKAWDKMYGGMEASYYVTLAVKVLREHPVDMLVFENVGEEDKLQMQIRSAGYDLKTDSILDETSVFFKGDSLEIKKFWFKLDDYGDKYVGTMIFPEDY